MELNQIRYFLAVSEALNFTTAAENCAVSQPALSKAIQKLEEGLGQPLLKRTSHYVELTDFGRTMRAHFQSIDESRRRAQEAARAANDNVSKKLSVGVMCTIGPNRFSGFLNRFSMRNPHFEIALLDVIDSQIPELLANGQLDCAFCAGHNQFDPRFQVRELFHESLEIVFAKGHRFVRMENIPLSEIAKEPYIDRLHCEFRDEFLKFTKDRGLALDITFRSEREDWALELLQRGAGISVMPVSSVAEHPGIEHRPVAELGDLRKTVLVSLQDNHAEESPLKIFHQAIDTYNWE